MDDGATTYRDPGRAADRRPTRSSQFSSAKFTPPLTSPDLVERSSLFDRLDEGSRRALTVVVGSAGAGKTTLLAAWLTARSDRPAAWIGCDVDDADPVRFVTAIVDASRQAFGTTRIGESTLQLLQLDGEVSIDAIAALTDDLERVGGDPILVIDDFHAVGMGPTADVLALLVQARPRVQIVVASRTALPLRLARLRSQLDVVELDETDLAFSLDDVSHFFTRFGLDLSDDAIAEAQRRTEGWPVGLQMTALSMQASPEETAAVDRADADGRTVRRYFLEEVLYRQPAEVADFMLSTSVLDELSVPACTALTGERASAMLEHLVTAHLFVNVIDEQKGLYRYHHLIREVLQAELVTVDAARAMKLHEAAAAHFLDTGHVAAAARHLLDAGNSAAAFALLGDRIVRDVLTNPTVGSPLDLEELSPERFSGVPEVLVPLAAELLWRGVFERGARAVALARDCDIERSRHPDLAVRLALVQMLHSTFVGDFDVALQYRAEAQAYEHRATAVDDWIVTLDTLAMYCHVYLGEFGSSRSLATMLTETAASISITEILCPGVLSQAALVEGNLDEAGELAGRSVAAAHRLDFDRHFFVFHGLRTTAQLALERRDLAGATELVERALNMVSGARPAFNFMAQIDRARIWAAAGDNEQALASLPAARAALKSTRSPLLAEADELEARLRLGLGDAPGALRLSARLPAVRRAVLQVVVALSSGDADEADRNLVGVPVPRTRRADVERQLLRANVALARSPSQGVRAARHALQTALECGFLQLVIDTAPQLVDHLNANPDLYPNAPMLADLMAARLAMKPRSSSDRRPAVTSPLTDAELRVIAKLAEDLSYADMADELLVSLNTVKTHLRHAYMKLGVSSRSSAIARASTLGLL